jgi:hypothetical protein
MGEGARKRKLSQVTFWISEQFFCGTTFPRGLKPTMILRHERRG